MRAILTLENGEKTIIPVEVEKVQNRKFIYIDRLEADTLKSYNRFHRIKAVKIHLLRH